MMGGVLVGPGRCVSLSTGSVVILLGQVAAGLPTDASTADQVREQVEALTDQALELDQAVAVSGHHGDHASTSEQ